MALEKVYINEKSRPLKHLDQYQEGYGNEYFATGAFIKTEGFRSWKEYLDSIDLARQISRRIS
ncbi:hypothetical protein [Lacicoccus alkaliphilus]|uniref:Uncharacterized protein n=1 Tax=Lacicoccus alkaliphilus DSM 16010 TaxID=1123231 RepID=A0A1M7BW77_9BACL|nr:hypothetical protein [Salinicoccus alkaliphilus]SHL59241.1 hypothetical protein SAMN02745189_00614 [Salinicoccus alkaliphilus DSM 16010]